MGWEIGAVEPGKAMAANCLTLSPSPRRLRVHHAARIVVDVAAPSKVVVTLRGTGVSARKRRTRR
jgi:hypothetical protein